MREGGSFADRSSERSKYTEEGETTCMSQRSTYPLVFSYLTVTVNSQGYFCNCYRNIANEVSKENYASVPFLS